MSVNAEAGEPLIPLVEQDAPGVPGTFVLEGRAGPLALVVRVANESEATGLGDVKRHEHEAIG